VLPDDRPNPVTLTLQEFLRALGKFTLAVLCVVGALVVWLWWALGGAGASYRDAYAPLRGIRMDERVLLANALAEGETPRGPLADEPIHPIGTLLALDYELLDERGVVYERWRVRALVPPTPVGPGDDGWNPDCRQACADAVAEGGGMTIYRSGVAGIAEHWLRRMPVGEPFSMGAVSLHTQDILDVEPFVLGVTSTLIEGRTVVSPADVRVTVTGACAAEVRAGEETRLEFHPHAMLPIPKELVTTHWLQLDGCGRLEPLPPRPRPEPVARVAPPPVEPFPAGTIVARREGGSGRQVLSVDEDWLFAHGAPVEFAVLELCRYDAAGDRWRRVALPKRPMTLIEPLTVAQRHGAERPASELPAELGLYRVRWLEKDPDKRWSNEAGHREALLPVGPMLCEDLTLGPAPDGRIAACVPQATSATATFLPVSGRGCED
jgi:hypothetical protein